VLVPPFVFFVATYVLISQGVLFPHVRGELTCGLPVVMFLFGLTFIQFLLAIAAQGAISLTRRLLQSRHRANA
jgi:hypothetical protein